MLEGGKIRGRREADITEEVRKEENSLEGVVVGRQIRGRV
jgi:hypothetical protein